MSALLYSLEPNLNFVAIRIRDVGVGETWTKFTSTEQALPADLDNRAVDVCWVYHTESRNGLRHL